MIRYILIVAVAILIPAAGYGQMTDVTQTGAGKAPVSSLLKGSKFKKSSLLDPSKISMSQQYSMLFTSGQGGSGATGLFMNTISYRYSPSMLLRVHIGVEHVLMSSAPSHLRVEQNGKSRIIPGFDFTYRPTDNTFFHVSYGTTRSRYLDNHYLATDPSWIEGASMTSPFPRDSSDWRLNISP